MANIRIKTFDTAVGTGCNVDVLVELWSTGKSQLLKSAVLEGATSNVEDYPQWYNLTPGTTYVLSVTNLSPNDTQANYSLDDDNGTIAGQAIPAGNTNDFSFVCPSSNLIVQGFGIINACTSVGITSSLNATTGRLELKRNGTVVGNIPNTATIDGWTNIFFNNATSTFTVQRTEGNCVSNYRNITFSFAGYTGNVQYSSDETNFTSWGTAITPNFLLQLTPGNNYHLKFRDSSNPTFVVDMQFTVNACSGATAQRPKPAHEFCYVGQTVPISLDQGANLTIFKDSSIVTTVSGVSNPNYSFTPTSTGVYTFQTTYNGSTSDVSIPLTVAALNTSSLVSGKISYMIRQNCVEKDGMKGCRFVVIPSLPSPNLAGYNIQFVPNSSYNNTKIIRESVNSFFIQIETGTTGGINITISNADDSHTNTAWSNSCDHDGCPTCCEDNQRSISVSASGNILTAAWGGTLAAWQKLNWYNTNIPTVENQTTGSYTGTITDASQEVIFQAQPTQYDNGTCYYHGWTRYIYRQHLVSSVTTSYTVNEISRTGTCSVKVGWATENDVTKVANFVVIAAGTKTQQFDNVPTGTVYFFAVDTSTNTVLATKTVTS